MDGARLQLSCWFQQGGLANLGKGEYDLAIADFDRVLKLDPKDADASKGRAEALAKKNK